MSTSKLFFGGLPTKLEVDKLMELIDGKDEGFLAPWPEVESIIGSSRNTNRALTVIKAWKARAFRERNIALVSVPGSGYRIAAPDERVTVSASMVMAGKRRIVKAATLAATTDGNRLNEEGRRTREHLMGIPARLRLAELTAPKAIN
jgi:hypothetical protein